MWLNVGCDDNFSSCSYMTFLVHFGIKKIIKNYSAKMYLLILVASHSRLNVHNFYIYINNQVLSVYLM